MLRAVCTIDLMENIRPTATITTTFATVTNGFDSHQALFDFLFDLGMTHAEIADATAPGAGPYTLDDGTQLSVTL